MIIWYGCASIPKYVREIRSVSGGGTVDVCKVLCSRESKRGIQDDGDG